MVNIAKITKPLTNYLYATGIFFHIGLIGALLIPTLIVHEPLSFFIERSANYLQHSGGSSNQRYLGKLLLQYLPINDWKTPQLSQAPQLNNLQKWQGQGASTKITYTKQQYNGNIPLQPTIGSYQSNPLQTKFVYTTKELLNTIKHIKPGETIQIMPGTYDIRQRYIQIYQQGQPSAPITLRSAQLGLVKINFNTSEGFHIHAPFWIFENLEIQGKCSQHGFCEHAFHVVGNGHSLVIRNNKIYDFNSPIKVNGLNINGKRTFPNYGLIEKNSIYNTSARNTNNPVNLININGADHWVVRSNLISDFSKLGGNGVSHGAFMKGNSNYGIFENNLIICEHTLPADKGTRIGLSFGGGGTGKQYCRNQDCSSEHTNGTVRNNIILNCSHDVGIYLNKSKNTQIYNNLLFNNLGVDIRFNTSTANIYNNIISGRLKNRDGGSYEANNNIIDQDCVAADRKFSYCTFIDWYWDIINADLELQQAENKILKKGITLKNITKDFCNNPRSPHTPDIGPIEYSNNLNCLPDQM